MTTLQLNRVKELIEHQGYSQTETAEELGIPYQQVRYWVRKLRIKLSRPNKHNRKYLSSYAAYDRNTDELIFVGTVEEVAAACHIKPDSMRTQMCRDSGRYQFIKIEND